MQIVNIHRGKNDKNEYVYAQLLNDKGELLIAATLDYIVERIKNDYLKGGV